MNLESITFENNTLKIINQSKLPFKLNYLELRSLRDVISAIKKLNIRGAPALGIVAAYGFYIQALHLARQRKLEWKYIKNIARQLESSRPTAVNISWAVKQMVTVYTENRLKPDATILETLRNTALQIHENDRIACDQIGNYGATLIENNSAILTHCNAGMLATGGKGTALAPIYTAHANGKTVHVYVPETRPVGQGARLTYWELSKNNISATLITDTMAASLMLSGNINLVLVGADRIAANGDIANKIGTYGLAILANYHHIPFYVAAPTWTIDKHLNSGNQIPIENRSKNEILDFWQIKNKDDYLVHNPAFDITPNTLVSGLITEKGLISKPICQNLKNPNLT